MALSRFPLAAGSAIFTLLIAVTVVPVAAEPARAAAPRTVGWSLYKNARFGFQISYPGGLFIEKPTPNAESGGMWEAANGSARLIATAAPNDSGVTLEAYRDFVRSESYADAKFDYTPMKSNWFVLSGQIGDTIFYERITFVCQGRFIYGWQVRYPAAMKRKFDAVVEAIHHSYRVGHGDGGTCG